MRYDWITTIIFAFFYFGFAQEYIKYKRIYNIIEPAISHIVNDTSPIQLKIRSKNDWGHYKQKVLENRYYCETGINIEEMAQKLNLGRQPFRT